MVKGYLRSIEGAEAIGSSGDHFELIVHAFNRTKGYLAAGPKPVEQQLCAVAQQLSLVA